MATQGILSSVIVGGGLGFRLRLDNPTLPSAATVTTAVGKLPAYARLAAVAPAGDLPTAATPPAGHDLSHRQYCEPVPS